MTSSMDALDDHILFSQYLAVCNAALERNSDQFPFRPIWQSVMQRDHGDIVTVHVHHDDGHLAHFRIRMDQGRVTEAACRTRSGCAGGCQSRQWHISAAYLHDVVDQAPMYIDNPARLDWEWLQYGRMERWASGSGPKA